MAQLSLATASLVLALTAPAMAAPPEVGTLIGTSGCEMVIGGSAGCTPAPGVAAGESAVVSPDGRNVYETSYPSSSPSAPAGLAAFSRNVASGALTQLPGTSGCMTATGDSASGIGTCTPVRAFGNGELQNLAITPDGRFIYVVSQNSPGSIVILSRDPATGALTQLPDTTGCITQDGSGPCQTMAALDGPAALTVSADGRFLYVSQSGTTGAILVLARDSSTGALSEVQCVANAPAPVGCDTVREVGESSGIVISPDGLHAFSNVDNDGISSLNRDPATGRLSQAAGTGACISDDGTDDQGDPTCVQGRMLEVLGSMAISSDGRTLYAPTSNELDTGGVAVLGIASDGSLSQPAGSDGCITNNGDDQAGSSTCATGRAVEAPTGVVISPDGRTLYVSDAASNFGGSDGVATFQLSASTDLLGQASGTAGCMTADGSADGVAGACGNGGPGLVGPEPAVLSPDGTSLYVPALTNDALIGFRRETAPVCQPASASTPFMTPVTITLSCSDPDGDPAINWDVASGPAHGLVNPVNQTAHTVQYFPAVLFSGADSFTFTVNDGHNTSIPQTATITVGPRPPLPPPPPVPRISRLRQSHARWREPGKPRKHAPPVGTTFSFVLNTTGRVTMTFTQRLPGRRVGGKCVAPSRRNAKRHVCTRLKPRGSKALAGENGINHRAFNGNIRHLGPLPLGKYTVAFSAAAHDLHSKASTLRFTIVS
jgi:DNA-binding beta-propeller fold protein YncE